MKILVTGGLGHIGSYLVRNLPEYEITIVDDLSTQRYCSLFHLPTNCKFIEQDFVDIDDDLLAESEVIIHLAAITDAASSFTHAGQINSTNIHKTSLLVDRIRRSGKLLIFPSTTSVYGKAKLIVTEDDAGNPQSPYAESKLKMCQYIQSTKTRHIIFRAATIYGISLGMRFHTAINKFCFQAVHGLPLTVWRENYNQVRPYLSLEDLVQAIRLALRGMLPADQTYNVLSQCSTLADVVALIDKIIPVKVDMIGSPLINQHSYEVSCEKIKSFGFRPTGSLEDGIKQTVELLT